MFVILVYDFGERRVAKALKICRKYLTWIQNSVFEGDITEGKFKMLTLELERVMDKDNDSLIIFQFRSKRYSDRLVIGLEKNSLNHII
ncbi:CRISPR-associated endonuclease Cas2 [Vallitalea pronyensis]|uniref:CRISPR-associated endoribonuclease Cas2 n=1 Tax=Vallitalea pronyensis TaxID=1348613 RepID=A0A8J8MMG2_9FIRM|nr:CRISPR-associated endonuclease Cas2 [Vallitalea pronyensis]QUI23973.1 CRISPR-associated endonuclease Cas2 [Vallitalea pronyensis]